MKAILAAAASILTTAYHVLKTRVGYRHLTDRGRSQTLLESLSSVLDLNGRMIAIRVSPSPCGAKPLAEAASGSPVERFLALTPRPGVAPGVSLKTTNAILITTLWSDLVLRCEL
jgi:hypothetical protein